MSVTAVEPETRADLGPGPSPRPSTGRSEEAGLTHLMECYRRSRTETDFAALFQVAQPVLMGRIRMRLKRLGSSLDAADVLQETLLNVYRYPQRFRADRSGAFRAWSGAILENAIRRLHRRMARRRERFEAWSDLLENAPDDPRADPARQAVWEEERTALRRTVLLLLHAYLTAYGTLSGRERTALCMVEVDGLRYKEVARTLGIRAEALKMVVFRARKRIYARLCQALAPAGSN